MGALDVLSTDELLWAVFLLAFKDPRKDFIRIVKRETRDGVVSPSAPSEDKTTDVSTNTSARTQLKQRDYEEVPYPAELLPRLSWVGTLLISFRLTDWKIGSPHHDRKQPAPATGYTHLGFIAFALGRSFIGYLLVDMTCYVIKHDPFFTTISTSLFTPPRQASVSSLPAILTALYTLPITTAATRATLTAAIAWALISQQYYLPTIFPVLLHYFHLLSDTWSPHLWPPYFGPASTILDRGLRGFWSTYWHQVMRFMVSGPGSWMTKLLLGSADHRNQTLEYFVHTAVAFGLSGVIHMGLVPRAPLHGNAGPHWIRLYIGAFFWLQPVGMLVEKAVAGLAARAVPASLKRSSKGRALGRCAFAVWIWVWACLCFPLLAEAGRQMGWFRHYTVPWSLVHWLRGEDAWMWSCLRA
ncbi:hypothetical protein CAC42_4594 [Sphaceloma murrayae]|uniref:Wax synthase domain-containing protein n=1 Tax=Sphaceloma murrayae TaxID=2082308 RepID=A0A2K1QP09_9PEZI|nr:hypothetical protein CAC42_4594 [Sphaceloma murrayae]